MYLIYRCRTWNRISAEVTEHHLPENPAKHAGFFVSYHVVSYHHITLKPCT